MNLKVVKIEKVTILRLALLTILTLAYGWVYSGDDTIPAKAPLFALVAAAAMYILMIPDESANGRFVGFGVNLLIVTGTLLAAVTWMEQGTGLTLVANIIMGVALVAAVGAVVVFFQVQRRSARSEAPGTTRAAIRR